MKRMSGRIGIGLGLASVVLGACFTERDSGPVAADSELLTPAEANPTRAAQDVVLAIRGRLERTMGPMSKALANSSRSTPQRGLLEATTSTQTTNVLSPDGLLNPLQLKMNVTLAPRANGAFRVTDGLSRMSVDVTLQGATNATREDVDGFSVYRSGYAHRAHVMHRTSEHGTEDYVFFPEELPPTPELNYDIAFGEDVAGLRFVSQTIELLDSQGAPRLRMNAPYAVDGDGRRLAVNVAIEGCAYDTSAAMPWGRPTTPPGARSCTIHLTWDQNAKAPLVVDPYWTLTDSMMTSRQNATSQAIGTNIGSTYRAIVVGGDDVDTEVPLKTTELYDESTRTWAIGPELTTERTEHAMVVVGGALVVIGGRGANNTILDTAEKVSANPNGQPPFPATWTTMSSKLNIGRVRPAAVSFDNGRILVTGGIGANGTVLSSVEAYDPSKNIWVPPPMPPLLPITMTVPRVGHTMTVIPSQAGAPSRAIVVGGKSDGTPLKSIELCIWGGDAPACVPNEGGLVFPSLPNGHANHAAVFEPSNGRFFVIGGEGTNITDYWIAGTTTVGTAQFPSNLPPRAFFTVTQSPLHGPGKYIIAGGIDTTMNNTRLNQVALLDSATKTITAEPYPMSVARGRHTAALLSDKRILIMGGGGSGDKSAELLQECTSNSDCAGGGYCASNGMCAPFKQQGAVCNLETDCWGGKCAKDVCGMKFCVDGYCCNTECTEQCAACDSDAPGDELGKCTPIVGEPHGDRMPCAVGTTPDDDELCGGTCDGTHAGACAFPKDEPCGSTCDAEKNTWTSKVCNGKGDCGCPDGGKCASETITPCGPYACDSKGLECTTTCDPQAPAGTSTGCNDATAVCNKDFQCVPTPTQCDQTTNEMILADGTRVSCEFFKCIAGACLTVCDTAYDCLPDLDGNGNRKYVCDESRRCVPAGSINTTGETDISCSTSPANQSSRFGWLAALALAGAFASRRNRARA